MAISFTPDEAGIYSMRPERPLHAFAVNTDPTESDLRAIDRNLLPREPRKVGVSKRVITDHMSSGLFGG